MGTRESILASLATRLATTADVTTVKRSLLSEFELKRYTRSQLPLVVIVEPDEPGDEYKGSHHAVTHLDVEIQLHYEQWNWDGDGATQVNALRDKVINKIHADISNGGFSHNTSATGKGFIRRTFPIFSERIRVRIDYYQSYLTR